MTTCLNRERRALLRRLALGLTSLPLASMVARGAPSPPLLDENDPAAKAEQYVADATRAKGAPPGALCSNCSIYSGSEGADSGACTLFPGKLVKAGGWCKSWSGL